MTAFSEDDQTASSSATLYRLRSLTTLKVSKETLDDVRASKVHHKREAH